MSEIEHIKGKIKRVLITEGMNFADGIKKLKGCFGVNLDDAYCDVDDEYIDEASGFLFCNGIFFQILIKDDIDPCDDIQRIKKIDESLIEFEFKFYNGGTCFSEMLEDSLTKLNIKAGK